MLQEKIFASSGCRSLLACHVASLSLDVLRQFAWFGRSLGIGFRWGYTETSTVKTAAVDSLIACIRIVCYVKLREAVDDTYVLRCLTGSHCVFNCNPAVTVTWVKQ